jgi:hypothetical protein
VQKLISAPRFASEPLMTEPVTRHIRRLWPRLGPSFVVGAEIPSSRGIIDLLVTELDPSALSQRKRRRIGPILRPTQIQVLWALRDDKPHLVSTVARLGGWSPSIITNVLPAMSRAGLVVQGNRYVEGTGRWRPIGRRLLAIELKREAWRRALIQASHFTAGADRAMVVLDSRSAGAVERRRRDFIKKRVGLALVSSSGQLKVIQPAPRNQPIGWLHALLAEYAWADALRRAQITSSQRST